MIGAWLDEWSEKLGFSPNKSSSDLQLVVGDGDGNGGGPAMRRASSTAQRSIVREQHALIAEYTAALAVMTDEVCQLDGELEAQRVAFLVVDVLHLDACGLAVVATRQLE